MIDQQMETVFPYYSKMGIAGFKIDYIDRDDQLAVAPTYAIAKLAAQYNLLIDYHGAFKPTGLQRTYPNVIGYEGVKGLENFKWANEDQSRYTNTIHLRKKISNKACLSVIWNCTGSIANNTCKMVKFWH